MNKTLERIRVKVYSIIACISQNHFLYCLYCLITASMFTIS